MEWIYVIVAVSFALVAALIGATIQESRRPETRVEQWERVYRACYQASDGETFDTNRRDKCIAAADKVMGCVEAK